MIGATACFSQQRLDIAPQRYHSYLGRNATCRDVFVLCLAFSHDYVRMTAMFDQKNKFSALSHRIIGCAIEVHRELGPGLLESTYQNCLAREFDLNGITYRQELSLPVIYKGLTIESGYRIDLLVSDEILLELKAVSELSPMHEAQILTYMKLARIHHGFLINFNVPRLKDGLRSYVL